jgi:hypothetical protein
MLRQTKWFTATKSKRGVRVTAKERGATPHSRVISSKVWDQLKTMSDSSFDGTCVLDLGIGVFSRKRGRK